MATLPEPHLRASAMNALAHGADSLCTPFANPVAELAALRGAALIARALDTARAERDPGALALGSILCAYALDSALFGLHHVLCQTLVRVLGSRTRRPTRRCCRSRASALRRARGPAMTALARALGVRRDELMARLIELGGGARRLVDLGAERARSTTRS